MEMKRNAQLTRKNYFSVTWIKLVYCLARKTLKCNSLVQKICTGIFLQKGTSLEKQLGVESPGTQAVYYGDYFYSNNGKKLKFRVFLLFHVRKHMISSFCLKWTEFTRNYEFSSNCGHSETRTKLEQIHYFLWTQPISGKMMMSYVFSH